MTTNIKGTSSTRLAHDLGISQQSAWYIAMRIGEAYFGGVEKYKPEDKKLNKGGGTVCKIAVVGIIERETGRVIAQRVKDTTKETLQDFIQYNLEEGRPVYTDEYKSYSGPEEKGYEYSTVKHSAGEWVLSSAGGSRYDSKKGQFDPGNRQEYG